MNLKIFMTGVLLLAAAGKGQVSSNKGKETIDRAVAALGGERFLHMQNRMASGRVYSFFHDQLSGLDVAKIYTEYLPDKSFHGIGVREREVLGKKQDYSFLFLEDQGWDITFRGARPIDDETWDRYRRITENDILYMLKVRYNEPGMQYDYVGTEVILSVHVEIVDITDAKDRTIRVYFDHNTMLPIRETFTWLDPETKYRNDEKTEFDKYRDIGGGIMWPYSIERERNGYKTYQLFANSIEANQSLPARIFELPPGAKVLKKVN